MTPLKAIRAHCIECSGGNRAEVRLCQLPDCPLFRFRFGRNPARAGVGPKAGPPRRDGRSRVGPGVPRQDEAKNEGGKL
jgi:hypothetical protein